MSDTKTVDTDKRLADVDRSIDLAAANSIPSANGELHALIAIAKALRVIASK